MKKPLSTKRQAIKQLRECIRRSRRLARSINRNLKYLAQLNKMKQAAQAELIRIMEQNRELVK